MSAVPVENGPNASPDAGKRIARALHGVVVKGAIVLDQPVAVPDGTRVEVIVKEQASAEGEGKPTLAFLLKYAGCMTDLPADFAEQHDHYIHGTPKR